MRTEVPVRVEYNLTPRGKSLVPIINELTEWAKENMDSIMRHRKRSQSV
ncbi:MAG: winged helix-turn-helix transcriptional regulator [Candidatus Cryptobacteroides sp.]